MIGKQSEEEAMSVTRRELFSMLPVALVPAILQPEEPAAQENAMPSAVYPFEKLPVRAPNGAQFRDVLKGKLATGESLEVHETTLPPGGTPHPPHHHVPSEICLIPDPTGNLTTNRKTHQLTPRPARP